METENQELDTEYGEDSIDTIAENILVGLGCNTEANHEYLFLRLEELVSYVTELCAEKAVKIQLAKKTTSSNVPEGTIPF